jgi:hypothetical protein
MIMGWRWRFTRPTFVQIRTGVLFAAGIAGVAYETLVNQTDRPTLLILFGAMMGLPLFLRADEAVRDRLTTPPPAPDPDRDKAPE